ncbi:MAG: Na/Pi symporter [Candidatus Nanopelagicales bacterium]
MHTDQPAARDARGGGVHGCGPVLDGGDRGGDRHGTEGLIPLGAGVAIILGSNIGTCVTAGLAAVGKPPAAVRTAAFHILVNVVGAMVWLFFIDQLGDIAVAMSPSYPELTGIDQRAAETPRQFAMAHTVFNLSTALVLVWFLGPIARLLERLIPDRPTSAPSGAPVHLDDALLGTPWAALEAAREEISALGVEVETMTRSALPALAGEGLPLLERIGVMEASVDARYHHIFAFLRAVSASSAGPEPARQAAALLDVADELEGIADTVDLTIAATAQELHQAGRPLAPAEVALLEPLADIVLEHLHLAVAGVSDPPSGAALLAAGTGAAVERTLAIAAAESRQRLASGAIDVPEYAVTDDVLEQYRRVHGASIRIVRARLTLDASGAVGETRVHARVL